MEVVEILCKKSRFIIGHVYEKVEDYSRLKAQRVTRVSADVILDSLSIMFRTRDVVGL